MSENIPRRPPLLDQSPNHVIHHQAHRPEGQEHVHSDRRHRIRREPHRFVVTLNSPEPTVVGAAWSDE